MSRMTSGHSDIPDGAIGGSDDGVPAHVLIAPDKFKGSLSAPQVGAALAEGLLAVGVTSTVLPLADGGDGSVDAAVAAGFTERTVEVVDAVGQPHPTTIALGYADDDSERPAAAVVEVANSCGLAGLPPDELAALDASSLGFGQAVAAAVAERPATLVLALGGSASTDGGTGLLTALGWVFRDADGAVVAPGGRGLERIETIETSGAVDVTDIEIVVAGDVTNPLTGPDGAAAVYGPQKGADPDDVAFLDAGLAHLVEVVARSGFPAAADLADSPGAGAAGGIGFAALLLGAHITSGAEFFLDLLDFDSHRAAAALVLTGEGSIDAQTEQGKLLGVLAGRAHPTPVVAVAGRNQLPEEKWPSAGFSRVWALSDETDVDTSRDPGLSADLLRTIGRRIGERLLAES